jgi:uncharacterized protein
MNTSIRSVCFTTMALTLYSVTASSQEVGRPPIIDMHVHAYPISAEYKLDFPWVPKGIKPPTSTEALMEATLAQMRKFNVVKAWTSGSTDLVLKWKAAAPEVIIGAFEFESVATFESLESMRALLASKRFEGIGEVIAQIAGLTPSDPFFEPYLRLAEEQDIPVAFHTGLPIPGVVYLWSPNARASLGTPLGAENALVRHPRLRAYIMHAGYPFIDDTIAFFHMHPQVYADLAEIDWMIPRAEFHQYLCRLEQAGFGKRLMFGSDQMWWPDAIGIAIEAIESAPCLSHEDKRDIFYNNAARFLHVDDQPARKRG